jgi:hypothetical protein
MRLLGGVFHRGLFAPETVLTLDFLSQAIDAGAEMAESRTRQPSAGRLGLPQSLPPKKITESVSGRGSLFM